MDGKGRETCSTVQARAVNVAGADPAAQTLLRPCAWPSPPHGGMAEVGRHLPLKASKALIRNSERRSSGIRPCPSGLLDAR